MDKKNKKTDAKEPKKSANPVIKDLFGMTPRKQKAYIKEKANTIRKFLKAVGNYTPLMEEQIPLYCKDSFMVECIFGYIAANNIKPEMKFKKDDGKEYSQINPVWKMYQEFRESQSKELNKLGLEYENGELKCLDIVLFPLKNPIDYSKLVEE